MRAGVALFVALWAVTCHADGLVKQGGGPLGANENEAPCITLLEQIQIQSAIRAWHAKHGYVQTMAQLQKYPFWPQSGTLWQDLFINNFCDVDPTTGIRDWDCSDYTYDGHQGYDVDLKSFGEQDIGVPIYAVLPGVVVARDDGHFDKNTVANGQPANYVILYHGGTQYTLYWHMKNGSVLVQVNDQVKAGQQLGQTASSGNSTGPHLHFESWSANGVWFEPSAGNCNPGTSNWVTQTPVRRDPYVRDLNVTNVHIEDYQGLPFDMPRAGTFVQGVREVSWWIMFQNMPANSTWRGVIRRPNGAGWLDSGTVSFNNPFFYRWSWWWWRYNVNFDAPGDWSMELYLNGQSQGRAPIKVVSTPGEIKNRRPFQPVVKYDPLIPDWTGVVFARIVNAPLFDDPDYDIVRYRFVWTVDGAKVRDIVSAGVSDCLPAGTAHPGSRVFCLVTASDGSLSSSPTIASTGGQIGN